MLFGIGKNHLAHRVDAIAFKEHVLGAAEADAIRSERDRVRGLFRSVSVGTHAHARGFGTPVHELFEVLIGRALACVERLFNKHLNDFRGGRGNLTGIHFASRAVYGKIVAFFVGSAIHAHRFGGIVDLQCSGAAHANFAHLTSNQGGV